ncbi:MAG TPA: proprotein convertase P-domain-containing protein [Kofleriaceae bacterium]|nr:proprotein convertase P-domain-containing protein [Kofleriaceae bacterium]
MHFAGRSCPSLILALLPLAVGCAGEADKDAPVEPPITDGKTDVADRTDMRGELALGGEVRAELVEDLEFHGYTLDVRAGAVVTLDVTRSGSSRSLDTSLFVYGPMAAGGGFGGEALAWDDDSGWGDLSRLRDLDLADAGRYLVVVGSSDGRGRGRYRLTAACESGECQPLEAAGVCNPVIADDIRACVEGLLADPDQDPPPTELAAIELCADAEPVADAYDAVCAAPSPPDFCGGTYEEFVLSHLPGCIVELQGEVLDRTCVFGSTFHELRESPVLHQLRQRKITSPDGLSALDGDQVILAVQASANTDVDTVEEALERVDQNEVNQLEVWDGTNRRSFTVYEYGAGDNSYGRLFGFGTTDTAALIGDGDIRECATTHGPEGRTCQDDGQCAEGLQCVGIAAQTGRGMCVNTAADQSPDQGSSCSAADDCALDSGLSCAGLSRADQGVCLPAWMRRSFQVSQSIDIPDGSGDGVTTSLVASGLATVDTDVEIQAFIFHGDASQLKVTLTNPAGTEVVIADRDRSGPELILDEPVIGFSGDEEVNGVWTLKVTDEVSGTSGTVDRWSLRIGSRPD